MFQRSSNYLLLGYYGMSNFGDDLFLNRAVVDVGTLLPQHGRLYSIMPLQEGLHGVRSVAPKWLGSLLIRSNILGSVARIAALILSIVYCRNILFWGGSVFSESSMSWRHRLIGALVRKRIVECWAYGVSLGPFESSRVEDSARSLLTHFSFIGVRDATSLKLATEWRLSNVLLVNDIAASLAKNDSNAAEGEGPIGVSICLYESFVDPAKQQQELAFIAACCRKIVNEVKSLSVAHPRVKLLVLNSHPDFGDASITRKLGEMLVACGITTSQHTHDGDVDATLTAISGCSSLICFRLHAAIVSYILQKPFVLYEYHEKCSSFSEHVRQGVRWRRGSLDWGIDQIKVAALPVSLYTEPYFSNLHKLLR